MNFEELKDKYYSQNISMTPQERREAYLSGERVDFLPFAFNGIDIAIANALGYTTGQMAREPKVKAKVVDMRINEFGIDDELIGFNFSAFMGSETVTPENGTTFIKDHFLKDYGDFDKLPRLTTAKDPYVQASINAALSLQENHPGIRIRLIGSGPWSLIAKIRSIDLLLRDIRKNKDKLIDLIKLSVETMLTFYRYFVDRVGKTPLFMTDPVSSMDLLAHKQYQELSLPYIRSYIDEIYRITGHKPGLHICGHTKEMWEDVAKLNISFFGIDNLEDIEQAKNLIGDQVVISGNIPPIQVYRDGTIDELIQATRDCIAKAGDSPKGFLIDAGCQMPTGVPMENIYAYIYALREYGRDAKLGEMPRGMELKL